MNLSSASKTHAEFLRLKSEFEKALESLNHISEPNQSLLASTENMRAYIRLEITQSRFMTWLTQYYLTTMKEYTDTLE